MKKLSAGAAALALLVPAAANAQHAGHGPAPAQPAGHGGHAMPGMNQPEQPGQAGPEAAQPEHRDMPQAEHGEHQGMAMPEAGPAAHQGMAMTGALGAYPTTREASGTAWQPDDSIHGGIHAMAGDWTLMGHALLNGVYDWQQGPRGDEMGFVSGMLMGTARRDFGHGTLQFRAMLSPDPLMGARGYPLHLAAGETANGITPLVDRQHPHDFFMELSASYSLRLSERTSLFLYAGLPGEPAFGPPAFMHRMSIMDSPEAPITHHWLDSTHITFGLVTAGLVFDRVKIEASRFNGREPDQHRWNIETGSLDSTSARISWNPTDALSLQASWARLIEPEQLEPGENQTRWSASAIFTRRFGENRWWSTTLAWGRKDIEHESLDAFTLESAAGLGPWTIFGRGEFTEQNELTFAGGHHGPTYDVGKISLGILRDFRVADHVRLGIGGLYAFNFVPGTLRALYDGNPQGAMAFLRLKID